MICAVKTKTNELRVAKGANDKVFTDQVETISYYKYAEATTAK